MSFLRKLLKIVMIIILIIAIILIVFVAAFALAGASIYAAAGTAGAWGTIATGLVAVFEGFVVPALAMIGVGVGTTTVVTAAGVATVTSISFCVTSYVALALAAGAVIMSAYALSQAQASAANFSLDPELPELQEDDGQPGVDGVPSQGQSGSEDYAYYSSGAGYWVTEAGARVTLVAVRQTAGEPLKLPSNLPYRTGHTCLGWADSEGNALDALPEWVESQGGANYVAIYVENPNDAGNASPSKTNYAVAAIAVVGLLALLGSSGSVKPSRTPNGGNNVAAQ